ncbi:hypothetical protein H4Q26_007180 [Puccinia striiformis f. sp. tritici PST-130]|nr:hypothetical protein H4Q26_007180 [Puccinia striiformis f. sp. tritici PST-130]
MAPEAPPRPRMIGGTTYLPPAAGMTWIMTDHSDMPPKREGALKTYPVARRRAEARLRCAASRQSRQLELDAIVTKTVLTETWLCPWGGLPSSKVPGVSQSPSTSARSTSGYPVIYLPFLYLFLHEITEMNFQGLLMVQVAILILSFTALSCLARSLGVRSEEITANPVGAKLLWKRKKHHKHDPPMVTIGPHKPPCNRKPDGQFHIIPPRLQPSYPPYPPSPYPPYPPSPYPPYSQPPYPQPPYPQPPISKSNSPNRRLIQVGMFVSQRSPLRRYVTKTNLWHFLPPTAKLVRQRSHCAKLEPAIPSTRAMVGFLRVSGSLCLLGEVHSRLIEFLQTVRPYKTHNTSSSGLRLLKTIIIAIAMLSFATRTLQFSALVLTLMVLSCTSRPLDVGVGGSETDLSVPKVMHRPEPKEYNQDLTDDMPQVFGNGIDPSRDEYYYSDAP